MVRKHKRVPPGWGLVSFYKQRDESGEWKTHSTPRGCWTVFKCNLNKKRKGVKG